MDLDSATLKARFRDSFASDEVDDLRGPLATDEATERRRWRRIVAACLPEVSDQSRAFDELWSHFADPTSWIIFPDVVPALERFRARGLRLCIGSNFDGRLRRVVAGLPEFAGWTESLLISSEVGFRKPHRSFYEAACRHLGLAPGEVLFAGDDPENDDRGPRRAGLHAHLIVRSGIQAENEHVSSNLSDFATFLELEMNNHGRMSR